MRPTAGRAPVLYLVTNRLATGGRPLAAVVQAALRALPGFGFPSGALAVQLREKDLGGRALLDLARPLRAVTAAAGVRLFVNDRVDVALAAGADGVHLGGGALSAEDVRAVAPHLKIGLSTHSLSEVARAAADPRIDFVLFGPVFETPSKRIFGPPQGMATLRAAASLGVPVVAIGGVQADEIPGCFRAGASGVASMSGVFGNSDPEGALRAFFRAIEST